METTLNDTLPVGELVALLEVTKLIPVTVSAKTLPESNINWEEVSNRLVKVAKLLSSNCGGAGTSQYHAVFLPNLSQDN